MFENDYTINGKHATYLKSVIVFSLDFRPPLWYVFVLQRRCGNGTDKH